MPSGIYKRTEKASRNMSKAQKGKRNALGKHWKVSEDVRKKMSRRFKGIKKPGVSKANKKRKDEKSANWKGGKWKNDKKYRVWLKNKRNRKKRLTEGSHTFGEWELLKKQYGYICLCCKKSEPKIKLTEDHIIPLSKGGSDFIENIQPLCKSCNSKKHTKIIRY